MPKPRAHSTPPSIALRWQPDVATDAESVVPPAPWQRPEPRDRILTAAARLFYRQGIRATGVDRIIAEADVAKATFYRHFPSKNDLVVAWLRLPQTRWIDWMRPEVAHRTTDPAERLLVFFDVLGEWFANPVFCGCPFLNSAGEMHDRTHPLHREFLDHEQAVIAYLTMTAAAAGLDRPEELGRELFLVAAGAIVAAMAEGDAAPAGTARALATRMIEATRS